MGLYGICIHMAQLELGFVGCLSGNSVCIRFDYLRSTSFRASIERSESFSVGR